jgi:hypothetical protein
MPLPGPNGGPMKALAVPIEVLVGSVDLRMRYSNLKICLRILKTKTI